MPVGVQQQVLVVTVQKTAEVPHLQFIDKVLTVPVDNFLLWRLWRWGGGFRRFCGIFRTPSIWTSSARLAATFLSPRWPTVVGRRGLPCCAAVFLDSIWIDTSASISCPHHHHHHQQHRHHQLKTTHDRQHRIAQTTTKPTQTTTTTNTLTNLFVGAWPRATCFFLFFPNSPPQFCCLVQGDRCVTSFKVRKRKVGAT